MKTSAERFYEHGDLMRITLERLSTKELVRVAPALLTHVVAIIYRSINGQELRNIDKYSPWAETYFAAIRIIDDTSPQLPTAIRALGHRAFPKPSILLSFLKRCPNLNFMRFVKPLHRSNEAGTETWQIRPDGRGGGRIIIDTKVVVYGSRDTENEGLWDCLKEETSMKGFAVTRRATLQCSPFSLSDGSEAVVRRWLLDSCGLPNQVYDLDTGDRISLSMPDVISIFKERTRLGKVPLQVLRVRKLEPYILDDLMALGESAPGLRALDLGSDQQHPLHVESFCELARVLRSSFPDLQELRIEINRSRKGSQALRASKEVIGMEPHISRTRLRIVSIKDTDNDDLRWAMEPDDLLDLKYAYALELACIGGYGCEYTCERQDYLDRDIAEMHRSLNHRQFGLFVAATAWTTTDQPVPLRKYAQFCDIKSQREELYEEWKDKRKAVLDIVEESATWAWDVTAEHMRFLRRVLMQADETARKELDSINAEERKLLDGEIVDMERELESELERMQAEDERVLNSFTQASAGTPAS